MLKILLIKFWNLLHLKLVDLSDVVKLKFVEFSLFSSTFKARMNGFPIFTEGHVEIPERVLTIEMVIFPEDLSSESSIF